MRNLMHRRVLASSLALLLACPAVPALAATSAAANDLGKSNTSQTVSVTLVLKLHNQADLENYIRRTVTPGDPLYHQFLTTEQFSASYGATADEISRVQSFLRQNGITPGNVYANHLAIQATGTLAQFNAAFQTSVRDYQSADGRNFHRPSTQPVIPSVIADTLLSTAGLSTDVKLHPNIARADRLGALKVQGKALAATNVKANGTATGIPEEYTVGDVANFYNINPLYQAGINGKGSTIGIVTLAGFKPSDAYAYWSMIGLPVKANRITVISVDGGDGLVQNVGDDETSLDVEQSGGLAPQANIRVYEAPNLTNGNFIDAFYAAVSDNIADSISTSWGEAEEDYYPQMNGGVDETGVMNALHQIFLEAAAQGISLFAAAGDSGAYELVREGLGAPDYSTPLTVLSPSNDAYMTAAGGTTLPYSFNTTYFFGSGGGPIKSITHEQVWGWDYIVNYLDAYDPTPGGWKQYIFSGGGGGGVSVYWKEPFYQLLTSGIRRSEPHQSLIYYGGAKPQTIFTLPANFQGRNMPDISLNADPETGYSLVDSVDFPGNGVADGYGGTSFVAPQLNGITALLRQSNGHRIGLWNPQIYFLQSAFGYGPYSSFNDIRYGDNWYYYGVLGYEPGAGIGTLNVSNFNLFLHSGL
ncbi:peptidase S53 [Dyella solisilvae]|uniref:Peptidase S53 n=1 Tax=Dyella solisilvae TaxID=1920168 RepID=A0A370K4Q2_9GAMM|nr:S53 family peptidase [Dyella solisilvae]RDI97623.1 peptidase S53 [Dyella solisilvae]